MATYGDIFSVDLGSGVETRTPVDNAWIRANTRQVVLSADVTSIVAGNGAIATISAQLKTMPLLDDSLDNVLEGIPLWLNIDTQKQKVTLDANGFAQFTVKAAVAGTYHIDCDTIPSNRITITAV